MPLKVNKKPLVFFVNGKKIEDLSPDPEQNLLTYLRDKLKLCGTKLSCGEGGCGACTVMISKLNRISNEIKHLAINACLIPICSIHGTAITTVEGIGSIKTKLHPVQERIAKSHGSQCGFCTPGMVMSMYALLRSSPVPSMKDLEVALTGNLCRCTGYRPILEGYRTFTKEENCAMGENCCKNGKTQLFDSSEFSQYDPTQELIFPPYLKMSDSLDKESLTFYGPRVTWIRPTTLKEILEIKSLHPDAEIVAGNTKLGIEIKFMNLLFPILISTNQIVEMNQIEILENGIRIGASVTIMDLELTLKDEIAKLPKYGSRTFNAILNILQYFASKQIRNVATVAGNIMTKSAISDLKPVFTVAGIQLTVQEFNGNPRIIKLGDEILPNEILISIFIPQSKENQFVLTYKQGKRRHLDLTIVSGAFNVLFQTGTDLIKDIFITFAGVSPKLLLAEMSASKVIGKQWNTDLLEILNKELLDEFPLEESSPGGKVLYRKSLILSFTFKAFLEISQELDKTVKGRVPISENEKSGSNHLEASSPKSSQIFKKANDSQNSYDLVGRPHVHASALKQASGEALYFDDIPNFANELYLGLVLSTKAHAKIISINPTEALEQIGVHGFFSGNDLNSDQNSFGAVTPDEQFFKTDIVTCQGQLLGVVVGESKEIAQRAAKLVKVDYEEISPILITIEDAIKEKSFYPDCPLTMVKGDVEEAFKKSDNVIEGESRIGGQNHFYIETNAAVAVPKDADELEVYCSSQHPHAIQHTIARVLDVPASKIVAKVKRVGGGFGGKESKNILLAIPVAFAAYRLGRPVRCVLDRNEDMVLMGNRHPFLFKYKIGCTSDGKITALEMELFNNGGYSLDLSVAVLNQAMMHIDNSYFIPNIKVTGWSCKTNTQSNTVFRGSGTPQAMLNTEQMIRHIANVVGKDFVEIAELNMYKPGDLTHFNQEIPDANIRRCWNEVLLTSEFHKRRVEIEKFNKENRWKKKGISIVPTKYGIAFRPLVLNQAGALVHIYTDGSVLITHGGIEVGQGLHTKMIQVASRVLQIPVDKIHVGETSTDKVPNASPTAASVSSDLNGMAVINACKTLMERLAPYQLEFPEESWKFWIDKAYGDRISLSATGFFATPNMDYNFDIKAGQYHNYYTLGAAVSEVIIDCLTGDHQILKTDIVMDLGESLNPAIDIGQIEGAFMQGYGLYTLEELMCTKDGTNLTRGPGMYKVPLVTNIPAEFYVSLLSGSSNPRAVYSSKAVGEPPVFLACSVFFAIKEAVNAARIEENLSVDYLFESPATSERIRMACGDKITKTV